MTELAFRVYQTHDASNPGMSDSQRKLERLVIPENLSGRRMLDIGCNEGFFCGLGAARGAAAVVGIDYDGPRLKFAREMYNDPRIQFRHQTWAQLPDGKFDLVLWTSAMHYELDHVGVLRNIARCLTPDGMLILECGAVASPDKRMSLVHRHSDVLYYPTLPLLREQLDSMFAVTEVGEPEIAPGDPIPRHVFHCRSKPPVVLLATEGSLGATIIGKASGANPQSVTVAGLVADMARSQVAKSEVVAAVCAAGGGSTEQVLDGLESKGLMTAFVELLFRPIVSRDMPTVLIAPEHEALQRELRAFAAGKYSLVALAG